MGGGRNQKLETQSEGEGHC